MTLHPDEQARKLRQAIFEEYAKALEMHIKEWPHLGDCEWNCTTVGPLHELIAKARLAELTELESDYHNKGYRTPAMLTERIASLKKLVGEK